MISFGVDMCSASSVRRSGSGDSGPAVRLTMVLKEGGDLEESMGRVCWR
jgi:hypothetical protein